MRLGRGDWRGRRRLRNELGFSVDFTHDCAGDSVAGLLVSTAAHACNDCKYSHACRAAPCSARFLVLPSARLTNASPPADGAGMCTSMVKTLRCSGPCSLTNE